MYFLKKSFDLQKGTVLITTAILMPVFLLITGMLVDIGRALTLKAELNKACMAAAEESIKVINIGSAENEGLNVLEDNYIGTLDHYFSNNLSLKSLSAVIDLDHDVLDSISDPKFLRVSCSAKIDCFFLKIAGIRDITVHAYANGRLKSFEDD